MGKVLSILLVIFWWCLLGKILGFLVLLTCPKTGLPKKVLPFPPPRLACAAFFRSGLGFHRPHSGRPEKGFFVLQKTCIQKQLHCGNGDASRWSVGWNFRTSHKMSLPINEFDGNANGHCCAESGTAGKSDCTVESFDGVFDDGQAQSGSANAAVTGT